MVTIKFVTKFCLYLKWQMKLVEGFFFSFFFFSNKKCHHNIKNFRAFSQQMSDLNMI